MMSFSGNLALEVRTTDTPPPRPDGDGSGLLCRPAEEAFKKGLRALKQGETTVARALFEAAMQLDREFGAGRVQPRFLSYFGMTLMDKPDTLARARDCCLRAVKEEFFNPDLFLNLSKVYLKLGVRGKAYEAAIRGLSLDPRHPGLTQQLAELGVRSSPPLRFLDRKSSLNVVLGRMLRGKAKAGRR